MDDLHDQLVKAYLDYFEHSEVWERTGTVRSYARVQQATKRIIKIAKARNTEIRENYQAVNPAVRKKVKGKNT